MRRPSLEALLSLLSTVAACGGVASQELGGQGGAGGGGGASSAVVTSASTTDAVATSSATTDVASSSSSGPTGPAGGGGDPTGCAQLEPLQLSFGGIRGDDSMDGIWSAGETALVNVTLTNTSDQDIDYPGVKVVSDNPLVTTDSPYNALFLIFAGETTSLGFPFTADASVTPGTAVTFVATPHSIQDVSCVGLPTLTMTATIE